MPTQPAPAQSRSVEQILADVKRLNMEADELRKRAIQIERKRSVLEKRLERATKCMAG